MSEKYRQYVRVALEESGISLRAAAAKAGMTHPQLSRYLNGRTDVTSATLERILNALGRDLKSVKL
ncbi:MAG: helix-turn-helix transcriptional regulator [Phycisphaeraceae bacterium]|nr:helix-turn-helix transcriptional regulator [Phycisphaeraceae bacterium]